MHRPASKRTSDVRCTNSSAPAVPAHSASRAAATPATPQAARGRFATDAASSRGFQIRPAEVEGGIVTDMAEGKPRTKCKGRTRTSAKVSDCPSIPTARRREDRRTRHFSLAHGGPGGNKKQREGRRAKERSCFPFALRPF